MRYEARTPADGVNTLAHCRYFRTERLLVRGECPLAADEKSFHALLCTEGEGEILFAGESYPIKKGDAYFVPAKTGDYFLAGELCALLATV